MLAMCWKCCNKITAPDPTGLAEILIGCKECDKVTDFASAQIHCPVTKELKARPHKTVPLKITPQ